MRERAGVGAVVLRAVDAAVQQLLVAVHPVSFPAVTDNRAGPAGPAWAEAEPAAGLRELRT
ncbi:hypothetical protein GCM10015536_70380 [Streptomyces griseomycini]|nr:hypothetical protein GCM10015536_70380 [Streptomyces griseomycini]